MKITKQELFAKGKQIFTEELKFVTDDFKHNPLIISFEKCKAKVETEAVSDIVLIKISLKGKMILHSTRTLKPVDYFINIKDQITYTYNKDLVDNEEIFLLDDDNLLLDPIFYSLIVASIPMKVIGKDDEEIIEGENWEVITEDEYNRRKNEEDSPFAILNDLSLDD